jgi:hypothetical protein
MADSRNLSSANLTVYRFDDADGGHSKRVTVDAPRKVMTARDLLTALEVLLRDHPSLAALPVHLLDMRPDEGDVFDGLLTDMETDCFDSEQGLVLSLMAWSTKGRP